MNAIKYHDAARKPCANCARKHLGQAIVLLQESIHGYPEHRWIAAGHIAEAEAEIEGIWQDMASEFRKVRNPSANDFSIDTTTFFGQTTIAKITNDRVARTTGILQSLPDVDGAVRVRFAGVVAEVEADQNVLSSLD